MFWLSYECFSIFRNAFLLKSAISSHNSCVVILLVVKIENITIFVDQNYTQVVENTCIINATIR